MNWKIRFVLWTAPLLIMFLQVGQQLIETEAVAETIEEKQKPMSEDVYEIEKPLTVTVLLERIYLDGEVSEEIYEETILSMEDFWAEYQDWQLVDQSEDQVVFQKHMNDISPLLKTNGYFGVTDDGILSIFEGKPDKSSNVIQSFFQIDIKKLESHQHEQLKKGIPVQSKYQYEKVIETFKGLSTTSTINAKAE